MILPDSLETLNFGPALNESFGNSQVSMQFADLELRLLLQSKLGQGQATGPGDLDFWCRVQSEPVRCHAAYDLETLVFGKKFDQSLAGLTLPSNLQNLTFGTLIWFGRRDV